MKTSTHYILHAISIALIGILSLGYRNTVSHEDYQSKIDESIKLGKRIAAVEKANAEYQKAIIDKHAETTKLEMMKDSFQKENTRLRRQLNSIKYEISLIPDSVANDSARDEITRYIAEFDL